MNFSCLRIKDQNCTPDVKTTVRDVPESSALCFGSSGKVKANVIAQPGVAMKAASGARNAFCATPPNARKPREPPCAKVLSFSEFSKNCGISRSQNENEAPVQEATAAGAVVENEVRLSLSTAATTTTTITPASWEASSAQWEEKTRVLQQELTWWSQYITAWNENSRSRQSPDRSPPLSGFTKRPSHLPSQPPTPPPKVVATPPPLRLPPSDEGVVTTLCASLRHLREVDDKLFHTLAKEVGGLLAQQQAHGRAKSVAFQECLSFVKGVSAADPSYCVAVGTA